MHWRRHESGLTLVEAAVGTVILGTLLTALVLANARLTAQTIAAGSRLEACRIAEDLLRDWTTSEDGVPRSGSGEITGRPGWLWHTEPHENEQADELRSAVISVRIFAPGTNAQGPPSLQLELLVPGEHDETDK